MIYLLLNITSFWGTYTVLFLKKWHVSFCYRCINIINNELFSPFNKDIDSISYLIIFVMNLKEIYSYAVKRCIV